MLYVNIALGLLLLGLSVLPLTGSRKHDPVAQKKFYIALSIVGILLAISAVATSAGTYA